MSDARRASASPSASAPDSPGTCPKCGAPLTRQTDRRKARGYSLRCSRGGHARPGGGPHGERVRRRREAQPRVRRDRRQEDKAAGATQRWLTDPTVATCKWEGCYWDEDTCPRHPRSLRHKIGAV
jgi:hypothetical protein